MNNKKWYYVIPIFLCIGFLLWYFSDVVAYILVAAVLSIIGQPLVKLLHKIKIAKHHLPLSLCAFLVLSVMLSFVFIIFWLVVPMIAAQADLLSGISVDAISKSFEEPIKFFHDLLVKYNLISANDNIQEKISQELVSVVGFTQFSTFVNSILGFAKNFLVAVFVISFITFFFLKDERLFYKMIMGLTPIEYQSQVKHVLYESKRLLTRYFVGICIDITIVILLITLGMKIIGLQNALIIGVFAGVMNIIPYVGPIIGTSIALLLGLSGNLGMDFNTEMIPLIVKIVSIQVCVNLLDSIVLQPTIYSNSVRAHPLEVFLVILIAGSVAGIPGMMLAIPAYTVLRIIAKEFFYQFYLVKRLTEKIN